MASYLGEAKFSFLYIDAPLDILQSEGLESAQNLAVSAGIELKELLLGPKALFIGNVVPFNMFSRLECFDFSV